MRSEPGYAMTKLHSKTIYQRETHTHTHIQDVAESNSEVNQNDGETSYRS